MSSNSYKPLFIPGFSGRSTRLPRPTPTSRLGARPRLKMSRGRYLRRQIELRTNPLQLGTLVPKSPHRFQVGDTGQLGSHADSPEKTGINSVDFRGSALTPIVKRILSTPRARSPAPTTRRTRPPRPPAGAAEAPGGIPPRRTPELYLRAGRRRAPASSPTSAGGGCRARSKVPGFGRSGRRARRGCRDPRCLALRRRARQRRHDLAGRQHRARRRGQQNAQDEARRPGGRFQHASHCATRPSSPARARQG